MKIGIIYIAINCLNDKKYVGKTTMSLAHRIKCHLKKSNAKRAFHCALKKYGLSSFIFIEIPCLFDKLNHMERLCIRFLKTRAEEHGYNLTSGGDGLCDVSEEVKDRMFARAYLKGKTWEEVFGLEKSLKMKKQRSLKIRGKNNYFCGKRFFGESNSMHGVRRFGPDSPNRVKLLFTDPFGKEIKWDKGLKYFCQLEKLSYSSMRHVLYGEQKIHKGWKVIHIRKVNL